MAVWRRSVAATHDFLTATDREEIAAAMADRYLPGVDLWAAERDGRVLGFSGTGSGRLEMLFVDADARGGGVGTALLEHAVEHLGVTEVDVNEQNEQAAGFYARHGFTVVGRSATDAEGRPYPMLQLRRLLP